MEAESTVAAVLGQRELPMCVWHLRRPPRCWLPHRGCTPSFQEHFRAMSFKAQFQSYSTRRFSGPQTSVNPDIPSWGHAACHVIGAFNFCPCSHSHFSSRAEPAFVKGERAWHWFLAPVACLLEPFPASCNMPSFFFRAQCCFSKCADEVFIS